MATGTKTVLSSLPGTSHTPCNRASGHTTSSPELPSLSDLYPSMPLQHPRGSIAGAIPKDVLSGFTGARSFLYGDESPEERRATPNAPGLCLSGKYKFCNSLNNARSPRVQTDNDLATGKGLPELWDISSALMDDVAGGGTFADLGHIEVIPTAKKKIARRKLEVEAVQQSKITKPKVSKPGVQKDEDRVEVKKTDKKQRKKNRNHKPSVVSELLGDPRPGDVANSCSKEAVKRRRDWTPVRDTKKRARVLPESYGSPLNAKDANRDVRFASDFGQSLTGFGFQMPKGSVIGSSANLETAEEYFITKKQKINLFHGGSCQSIPAERKGRNASLVKKPQTITDKATAPFVIQDGDERPSLLHYFATHAPGEDSHEASTKGKGGAPRKRKDSKSTAGKKQPTVPVLLSPASAMKKVQVQELVFGTSSQLARDESPTFLRELQQAMRESERTNALGEAQATSHVESQRSVSGICLNASKSLWTAATRDFDDSFMEIEPIILEKTKALPKTESHKDEAIAETSQTEEVEIGVEDGLLDSAGLIARPETVQYAGDLVYSEVLQKSANYISVSEDHTAPRQGVKAQPQTKEAPLETDSPPRMPNYNGFTELQLKKAISSYGFKAIKRREDMIKLLQRCWESKNLVNAQVIGSRSSITPGVPNVPDPPGKAPSGPAKRKGRPPKQAAGSAAGVPISDRKPRGRPKKDPYSKPSPKTRTTSSNTNKSKVSDQATEDTHTNHEYTGIPTESHHQRSSPERRETPVEDVVEPVFESPLAAKCSDAHRDRLMKAMTKAVSSVPPTHSIKNLTWHEKVLLYDPIVIEDLTAWLNKEGLSNVDEDDEVSVFLVKQWCESQSICCLWRESLKGNEKSGGKALFVHELCCR